MPITQSKFTTGFGLSSPNLQTMLPSIMPVHELLKPTHRERFIMPDTDFFDVDWFAEEMEKPIVIILHGMTGAVNSHYVQSILKVVKKKGWRPVLMYYRGCSGEPNLLDRSYHVGDTMVLDTLVTELRKREPHTPIAAVGYSMGANMLLKWLGEIKRSSELCTAVAVSPPFDLRASINRLREGFSRFYQWWLIGDLHDYMRRKYQEKTPPFDFGDVTHLKSLWEFDEAITAPLNGFMNATDYYEKNSCRQFLSTIGTPTLIIHAKDDPFLTLDAIPLEAELAADTTLELSEHGGHVGFVSGNFLLVNLNFWLEKRILPHLEQYFNEADNSEYNQLPIHKPKENNHVDSLSFAQNL